MEPQELFNRIWDPVNHSLRMERVAPGAASTSISDGHGVLADVLGASSGTDVLRVVPNEGAAG